MFETVKKVIAATIAAAVMALAAPATSDASSTAVLGCDSNFVEIGLIDGAKICQTVSRSWMPPIGIRSIRAGSTRITVNFTNGTRLNVPANSGRTIGNLEMSYLQIHRPPLDPTSQG